MSKNTGSRYLFIDELLTNKATPSQIQKEYELQKKAQIDLTQTKNRSGRLSYKQDALLNFLNKSIPKFEKYLNKNETNIEMKYTYSKLTPEVLDKISKVQLGHYSQYQGPRTEISRHNIVTYHLDIEKALTIGYMLEKIAKETIKIEGYIIIHQYKISTDYYLTNFKNILMLDTTYVGYVDFLAVKLNSLQHFNQIDLVLQRVYKKINGTDSYEDVERLQTLLLSLTVDKEIGMEGLTELTNEYAYIFEIKTTGAPFNGDLNLDWLEQVAYYALLTFCPVILIAVHYSYRKKAGVDVTLAVYYFDDPEFIEDSDTIIQTSNYDWYNKLQMRNQLASKLCYQITSGLKGGLLTSTYYTLPIEITGVVQNYYEKCVDYLTKINK